MSDENIKQKAVNNRGLGSPETRGALFVGILVLIVLISIGFGAYSFLAPDVKVEIKTGGVDASNVKVEAGAKSSEAYKEAKRDENSDRYEVAKTSSGGVAIPFTFDEEPQGGQDGKDINNCGCTINDQQLKDAIKRLGFGDDHGTSRDHMRVDKSDVYIATSGQLMGEDGEPLSFRLAPIFMEASGQLLDEKGISVLSKDKEPLYLGASGNVIDRQARSIPLLGDLLMSNGAVLINNGRLANRPGNMLRVGRSDVYVTTEGQLVTMDGKPIRHSGAFVYQNDERKLINRNALDVAWEQQSVYQNKTGQLVNVSGGKFNQPGILFSYEGILIDNDGMLTRPLVNIEKIGNSDIYKTKSGNLVDGYGLPITYYGEKVRIGLAEKLFTTKGHSVVNRTKSEIYLTDKGVLRVDVGKGSIQTGALKTSENIALDRHGQMITRRGRLERRGASDIFLTADGFLSDKDGKPILFSGKDTFIDFSSMLTDGSQALETVDQLPVVDKLGNRVYLTLEGRMVDYNGDAIKDVGILSSSDGVLITSSGKKVIQENEMERVVTKDGQPVTYNGKEVFKGEDGRLYDIDGNPILTPDGRAVFMDENGNLVDESGRVVDNIELMAGERPVQNGELSTRKKLTTATGERILHDGKEVYVDASGRVIDENGNPVLTKDGREVFVDASGNIVDKNGNKIEESLLKTESGKTITTGLIVGREQVITKDGKVVKFNGRDVFKGHDGALYDENGNAITTKDGKRVFLDSEGNMVDEDGKLIVEDILSVVGERFVTSGDLSTRKQLVDSNGVAMKFGNKDVFISKDGRLVDENGQLIKTKDGRDVYVDKNGNLVDKSGNKISENLLSSISTETFENGTKTKVRQITSADGKAVKYKGKDVFAGDDGRLYDENGNVIRTKDGREVFVDKNGNLVDKDGNKIQDDLLTNSDGEKITSGLKKGVETLLTTGGVKSIKQLMAKDGTLLSIDGKAVFIDELGRVVDEDGNVITSDDGRELYIDKNGNLVDVDGNRIEDDILQKVEHRAVKAGEITTFKQMLDKNGNAVFYDGKEVFTDKDGRLVDEFGNVIKTADGKDVFIDENGNLIDQEGNQITEALLKDITGKAVRSGLQLGKEKLVSKDGQSIKYKGKDIFKADDGSLIDKDGNPILSADGKKIFVNESGDLVDEDGNLVIDESFSVEEVSFEKDGLIVGRDKLITKDGKELTFNGKSIFKSLDGSLIDAQGNPILSKDGKKIFVDDQGRLVDEDGVIVNDPRFETIDKKFITSGLKAGLEQITTKDGKAVKYKGKNVFKANDGSLIGENGEAILTSDGRKVYMNADGELVDVNGNIISEGLLTADSKPVESGQLTSIPVSEMKKVGSSDIYVTRDGTLLDKNGKAITFNGKKVRVGKNGQLIDENGNPIVDKNGKPVFMNAKGELVDNKGNKIEDTLLADGDGVMLDQNGKSISGAIIKVGDSDIYKTEDGRLVDKEGKAIQYNGENVYVGNDGRLYYQNGKPVTDKNGNSVYLDPTTGKLIDRNGKTVEGSVLTNSEGTLIDSNGELITAGGKLKRIQGTDLYRTDDGQVVDSEGKPVIVNGEPVYVDETGKVVNKFGKPIRFKGQELFVSEDGRLVDRNGQPLLDSNNRAIRLSDDGGIINEDGESVDNATGKTDLSDRASSGFKKTVHAENTVTVPQNTANQSTQLKEEVVPPEPQLNKGKRPDVSSGDESIRLDQASAERLQRRYTLIKTTMRNQLMNAQQNTDREVGLGFVAVGGKADSGIASLDGSSGKSPKGGDSNSEGSGNELDVVFQKAGTMMYAVTSYQINSDYIKETVVDIVGLPPKHPLYNAKAMGKFELAYDRMVLTFDKICPMNSECVPMKGVALDPGTSAAALASDVDHHYWYRYGGLFLASVLEGTAEAMSESGTREESTSSTGTKVTTSGLDGDKLILRSLGKVGERFSEAFADNINRPSTAWLDPGEEMAIMLFDDIKGSAE